VALLSALAWGLRRSLVWLFLGLVALGGGWKFCRPAGTRRRMGRFSRQRLGILTGLGWPIAYLARPGS
jgi:hypothetical protein